MLRRCDANAAYVNAPGMALRRSTWQCSPVAVSHSVRARGRLSLNSPGVSSRVKNYLPFGVTRLKSAIVSNMPLTPAVVARSSRTSVIAWSRIASYLALAGIELHILAIARSPHLSAAVGSAAAEAGKDNVGS
jgi:hypothetical protein